MMEILLNDASVLSIVGGVVIASGFAVLSGVALLLRRQNKNMQALQAELQNLHNNFYELKTQTVTMMEEAKSDRTVSFERTYHKFEQVCEHMVQLENRIFDAETSKQSGHRVNEAIRLAQLQTTPEVIVEQTGIPLDMAKAIATFHLS